MPANPTLPAIDTADLHETVAQICSGHDRLDEFLRGLFGDLESLTDELTRQTQWIDSTERAQETRQSEYEERIVREREALEATFQRIQELTDQVESLGGPAPGGSEQVQALLERMNDDLAATRQDLTEAREELRTQREFLSQAPSTPDSAGSPELQGRLDQLEEERLAWAQERAALETELDAVRNRVAELTGTLDDERQQASKERKDWTEELRQMRRQLQTLGKGAPAPGPGPAFEVQAPESTESEEHDDAQDPVLDSVMAQFEILQKDLARRRKAKPAAT